MVLFEVLIVVKWFEYCAPFFRLMDRSEDSDQSQDSNRSDDSDGSEGIEVGEFNDTIEVIELYNDTCIHSTLK